MARNRMIKTEFWSDEKLAINCSRDARLLFIGLWNYSDDYGVVKGHPLWLKNQIFPYDNITIPKFEKWLTELSQIGVIIAFKVNNEKYFYITHFLEHQIINNPSKRVNPMPPKDIQNTTVGLTEDYGRATLGLPFEREGEGKGKEKEKEKRKNSLSDLFDIFWKAYPGTKTGKKRCFEKWLIINPDQKLFDKIMRAIQEQKTWRAKAKPNEFRPPWKNPLTWLNQECWNDEVLSPSKPKPRYRNSKCPGCGKPVKLNIDKNENECPHCYVTICKKMPDLGLAKDPKVEALTAKVADSTGGKR